MNGKITASPKVKEVKSYRRHHFLNGSAYRGLRPDADTPPDDYSYIADYKWTQYFDVSYGVVAENRDHNPDAEPGETNSEKYKLFNDGGYSRHGNEFRSARKMYRNFSTARQDYVYNSAGERFVEYTKKALGCTMAREKRFTANTNWLAKSKNTTSSCIGN